jgi:hypothetical protein
MQNSTPVPPPTPKPTSVQTTTAHKPTALEQRFARIQDDVTKEISDGERAIARAHFLIGEVVMTSPALFALISPQLEPHLVKMGPKARKPIDTYADTRAEIYRLRKLLA